MDIAAQLDLFQHKETAERDAVEQRRDRDRIATVVARLRVFKNPHARSNHTCSAAYCHPQNEQYFIDRLPPGSVPPALDNDVFMCDFGRIHVCSAKYRECVIRVDAMTNNTCVLTGRHYGTGVTSQHQNIANDYGDSDNIGGGDGREDDAGANHGHAADMDYERDPRTIFFDTGVSPLASNARTLVSQHSRFVRQADESDTPARPPPQGPAGPQSPQGRYGQAQGKHRRVTRVKAVKPQVGVFRSSAPVEKKSVTTTTTARKHSYDLQTQREEVERVIKLFLFSETRQTIGKDHLSACVERATKDINDKLRLIRTRREAGEAALIDHYALFNRFLAHININPQHIAAAPPNPKAVARAIDTILRLWKRVVETDADDMPVFGKHHLIQHAVAVLYLMRTGLVLNNEQIVPACEYMLTYLVPMDFIKKFSGFRENFYTKGIGMIHRAYGVL